MRQMVARLRIYILRLVSVCWAAYLLFMLSSFQSSLSSPKLRIRHDRYAKPLR